MNQITGESSFSHTRATGKDGNLSGENEITHLDYAILIQRKRGFLLGIHVHISLLYYIHTVVVDGILHLGNYSIFIKVYARNNEHLKTILLEKLQVIKGITRTETMISLEQNIDRQIPVE